MPSYSITRKFIKALAFTLALCLLAPCALSQTGAGTLRGSVTDELGSLVVNAKVFARSAKGEEIGASSNASGVYEFKSLAPGVYSLRVVAVGFNVFEQQSVAVQTGRVTILNVQLSVALEQQSVTVEDKGVSADADRNADAVVLRQQELAALPNDPQALSAALQAMAGPSAEGQTGASVTVDGFSNGQVPPKESIREVRINQNPYAAENEYPGWGGIEIYTQPGSDKWHGGASFDFNDESLNSRNPFAPRRAPYQQRSFDMNLSGPVVPKRSSFSIYAGRNASDVNSLVNATTLDPASLLPVVFNRTFVTPQVSLFASARGDLKINKRHTLVGSYRYDSSTQKLQGIGGFSLPSRAFSGRDSSHTLQLTETALLNERTVNETRFQFAHNSSRQTSDTAQAALNVLDSFFGGGAQVGSSSSTQDRFELQNFTSLAVGRHFFKVGGRIRGVRYTSISQSNFGGTYTFAGGTGPLLDASDQIALGANGQPQVIEISSLERYRRTLLFARRGLSASEIRNLGGGATQFSIAGGEPLARVSQTDISLYAQDDWKLRPNFSISPGLRYENQNNISSPLNFAPRIGFAWAPAFGSKKKTTPTPQAADAKAMAPDAKATTVDTKNAASSNTAQSTTKPGTTTTASATTTQPTATKPPAQQGPPRTVLRGGIGLFYIRISEALTLQALRFNGVNQRQFVVSDPSVLDLFPSVPALSVLDSFAVPQTRRLVLLLTHVPQHAHRQHQRAARGHARSARAFEWRASARSERGEHS
jgi:hypothetical protein